MSNCTRAICNGVWHVPVVAGLVLAVIPQGWVPGALTSYLSARGEFSGEPFRLNVPKGGKPTAALELRLAEGVCRVYIDHEGGSYPLFSAQAVSYIRAVPAGSRRVLDPEGNTGSYEVGMGLP